jgi:hypothetical protein
MPKPTPRRQFMLASSLLAFGSLGAVFYNRQPFLTDHKKAPSSALSSIIDTVIPGAVISSKQLGAIDLEIDKSIKELSTKDSKLDDRLSFLISTIDALALKAHARSFAELDIDRREVLLNDLLNSRGQIVARNNLNLLRNLVMELFYTKPEGHRLVGFTLPAHYKNY